MSKIRGKDFAKTVIITPEETETIQQKAAVDKAVAEIAAKEAAKEAARLAMPKGPRKGLGGWSIFFLIVVGVVLYYGIVALLMHFNMLPLSAG